ncbi:MAG: hypothetical protein AAGB27_08285 [Pseudomonadota bacterium]
MTRHPENTIEDQLRTARRSDSVGPALHESVMRAVSVAQRETPAAQPAPDRRRWWPALAAPMLGGALAASLIVAIWFSGERLPTDQPAPIAPDPAALALTVLLEERLAQPLDKLQGLQQLAPLEAELAALESDLKKMKPRWPWASERAPAG